jgi:hypothetical protein
VFLSREKGATMKAAVLISAFILAFAVRGSAQDPGWPRQQTNSQGRLVYYQPQVDSWNNHSDLKFRLAFSLTPTGGKAVLGVANVDAKTDVNVENRTAIIRDPIITDTHFPSLDQSNSASMDQLVRTFLSSLTPTTISLDRLIAGVRKSESIPTVELRNDPPQIFVSYRPAVLLHIDGQPVLADIPKTQLQFVVNTNWPIFFDKSHSTYYFFNGKQWMSGSKLEGPWAATQKLPKEIGKLTNDSQWAQLKSALPPAAFSPAELPSVIYTTVPADIILFRGQPVYERIQGTQLVYASNTDADVFVYGPTNSYYYLSAGRWFSATTLQGPWTYATPNLPADFARIPLDNPESRVLVSVPGTEQAKDAVLLAQIPTTVKVDPTKAAANVNVLYYGGTPQFNPIEGTSLSYATNTVDRVLRVGDVYYLCLQGIWFMSTTAQGPWTTASSVPGEVYTIPPSSPVYNVTYVTQTTTSSGDIEASYTAGYFGSFVLGATVGAIIAGGTGYYYPPYFYYGVGYPIYRPWPATYGYGSFYNSYTGAYGVARGVYGPYGGATGWASYNPYTGTYARGASAYGPYGSASAGRAYNPYTGSYARGGSVATPYGSRSAAQAYNRSTGVGAATRQGSSPYGQWGSSVAARGNQAVQTGHVSNAEGTMVGARSTSGAKAIAGSGSFGEGGAVKSADGDLYAGRDGNLYKNTGDGWQRYDNGNWNSLNRLSGDQNLSRSTDNSLTRPQGNELDGLNGELQNRQRGSFSAQNFQNFQRSVGDWGGGGGGFANRVEGGGGWGSRFSGGGFGGGRFGGRRR